MQGMRTVRFNTRVQGIVIFTCYRGEPVAQIVPPDKYAMLLPIEKEQKGKILAGPAGSDVQGIRRIHLFQDQSLSIFSMPSPGHMAKMPIRRFRCFQVDGGGGG